MTLTSPSSACSPRPSCRQGTNKEGKSVFEYMETDVKNYIHSIRQSKEMIPPPVLKSLMYRLGFWVAVGGEMGRNSTHNYCGKLLSVRLIAQLMDVQVFATPRIILRPLVPAFPCFGNVTVTLIDKPYVDFGLRLLIADVMAVPGFYQFIQMNLSQNKHSSLGNLNCSSSFPAERLHMEITFL